MSNATTDAAAEFAACCGFRFVVDSDEPIRAEQYSLDRLDEHARQLAARAPSSTGRGRPLLRRFFDNSRALARAHRVVTDACRDADVLGTDAEWFIDNFHIIEDALREVRADLPSGYYAELPKLEQGSLAGFPRIYALALELLAHTDSGLDEYNITRVVQAYQTVTPLTIGELWAVPIMLRLAALENLRRLAHQMVATWQERCAADVWAQAWRGEPGEAEAAQDGAAQVRRMQRKWQRLLPHQDEILPTRTDSFVVRLLLKLRDFGPSAESAVEWLEQRLTELQLDPADVLQRENQRQAANQVSVGNCVTSLRLLSALDWTAFFEHTSHVEKILCEDPAGVYPRQDFATKDRYRQAVERLARGAGEDELSLARRVVAAARRDEDDARRRHVGYYLVDRGRRELEADLGFRATLRERWQRAVLDRPHSVYFVTIASLLAVAVTALVAVAAAGGTHPAAIVGLAALALVPLTELAVGITNHLVTMLVPPRVLPKLDFENGVPPEAATVIAIPSMLMDAESATRLAERLEVHYLANPDAQFRFALLTDFRDAKTPEMPDDEQLLNAARVAVTALNQRYGHGTDRFFLFHRRRVWNPVQHCYMGWERKRGKLLEFFRLLRDGKQGTFSTIVGDVRALPHIRYCITLDTDTTLPRESGRRLVGIIHHPLNQPRFDPQRGLVVEGYAIVQPRIGFALGAAGRSLFAWLGTGSAGIDPYTTAVSDVYQDLFGSGSYTGKGIVHLDAFHAAVGRTFPDNHILSHDLIEGNYARCALASDVELLDEFPSRYDTYMAREHRWVRGDWQILPWLLPSLPSPHGDSADEIPCAVRDLNARARPGRRPNPLPLLARWKIFDNLRRSLVAPALIALLVAGWLIAPVSGWIWTGLAAMVVALPLIVRFTGTVLRIASRGRWRSAVRELHGELPQTTGHVLLSLTLLADHARTHCDAVARTLVRLFVTRRHLLEWEAAAAAERRLKAGFAWHTLWPTSLAAALLAAVIALARPGALAAALPLLISWIAAPAVAAWVSRPRRIQVVHLSDTERAELRRIARKTWAFFESFIGDVDHWLPPDNFQEDPKGQIAHRTSPTNIGMLLVSTLSAHDLGYIGLGELADRVEKTFGTLDQLERLHGHWYNWYDTRTLRPLEPQYVSTVDSGNLLACLITLKQGLFEKLERPRDLGAVVDGLADVVALVAESVAALPESSDSEHRALRDAVDRAITDLRETAGALASPGANIEFLLVECERGAAALISLGRALADSADRDAGDLLFWADRLAAQLRSHVDDVRDLADHRLARRCHALAERADRYASSMRFGFLYNERRHLFVVGHNATLGRADSAHYDLLASEACLTSLLAIARGEASRKHWFQLARPLTTAAGSTALVSWGGTMFEYLMPRLLCVVHPGTLLHHSHQAAVARQIEYGRQRRVPWGISESAFSVLDVARDYQYQSFGVPGLGLKRGLADELVVAPYATALALAVQPRESLRNFRRIAEEGGEGRYGFYEAIDYTRARLPDRQRSIVVRCFMAHHQGMILTALGNCLLRDPMPRRFHADAMVRAAELLLQERVPRSPDLIEPHSDEAASHPVHDATHPMVWRLPDPATPTPRTHLLSNGRYHVFVSNALGGASTCRGIDVTRWREDRTRDGWGQFLYVRDLTSRQIWSAGFQPMCRRADRFEVIYSVDKAEFRRLDGDIGTNLEIVVPPEQLAEIRRLTLVNHDRRPHRIELTSYAELVLGPRTADLAHPAFGKLFLETEFIAAHDALLCRRRPRGENQKPIWAVQVLATEGPLPDPVQFETDRARFIGRGRTLADPAAIAPGTVLSRTVGPVLDPIFSLRRRVRVPAGGRICLAFTTAVADSREEALALADQYHDLHAVSHAFELAWANSQVELRHLHLTGEDAHLFQRLAAHLLYSGPTLRPPMQVLAANRQDQTALWRYGISGDKPILLVRLHHIDDLPAIRQLLVAHAYWRRKGLEVDLLIMCEETTTYFEELYQQVQHIVRASDSHTLTDLPGGVFVRKATHMPEQDRILLQAAARVVLNASRSLSSQLRGRDRPLQLPPDVPAASAAAPPPIEQGAAADPPAPPASSTLQFWNGYGGFSQDGREYHIIAPAGQSTPAPWINVVSNPSFGFLVSESGSGCTWAGNSQSNRLTPWSNDPVSDPAGEIVYLRDESTGEFWTVTPRPAGPPGPCHVRHGQGYSVFKRTSHDLEQELRLAVPIDDPVKVLSLTLRNSGRRRRRLSATFYVEWVLGTVRDQSASNILTSLDGPDGALLTQNPFHQEYAARFAFADVNLRPRSVSADRTEFIGRNGTLADPAALHRQDLAGRHGANLDPCAAIRVQFELAPGDHTQVVFLLGQAESVDGVRQLADRYRARGATEQVLHEVTQRWDDVLGRVQVRTPNRALDLIVNRWLLYQSLSCRVWGRSGFYQSSGAYGFRDQLQDIMALVYAHPEEARRHILRCAARQFREGDVQHWWHPPFGRGVRTRCSDDYLWLPFATCHYVETTGDSSILDEPAPFLEAPPLGPDQEDDYRMPDVSSDSESLYEHCVRATEYGLRVGPHGIPLIGSCDWNDGYNRVGHLGRGESVWNGWFLIVCLRRMAELAEPRGQVDRARAYRAHAEQLRVAIEQHAWDGRWYRRAFFDDGTPLGSSQNDECRIDSLAQSWAVLSGAADPKRAATAMAAVIEQLVQHGERLIQLFTPPWDKSPLHPGYVKGYVPGIRENGGQYTHAATWVVQAVAMLGQGDLAVELFDMLNPLTHSGTAAAANQYKTEPYAVAADVYSEPPHKGRGGWTWYTGSAAWLYRAALESILGFRLRGDRLHIEPAIPRDWPGFELTYRYRTSTYRVRVETAPGERSGTISVTVDGTASRSLFVQLVDDGRVHEVVVAVGQLRPSEIDLTSAATN